MPPRPRRTSHPIRRQRRRTVWAQLDASQAFTANNQWATLDLLQTFKASVGASVSGVTVVRTLLKVVPRSPAAADRWWIGLKVYDLDDITGATTTNALVPNPRDNPYLEWAWNEKMIADQNEANVQPGYAGRILDVRSRRRLHQVQETLGLCIYQDTVGTVAKTYDVFCRTLLLMP